MARIRSVHPGLFTDESFVSVSDAAQIFYIGLLTEADDQGVFEWKPLTLKMRLRPASLQPVDGLLAELEAVDRVVSYEIAGRKYGAIRNFRKFQKPKYPNATHPTTADIRNYVGLTEPIPEMTGVDERSFPPIPEMPRVEDPSIPPTRGLNINCDAQDGVTDRDLRASSRHFSSTEPIPEMTGVDERSFPPIPEMPRVDEPSVPPNGGSPPDHPADVPRNAEKSFQMEKKEDVEEEVRKKGSEAKASAPKGARKVDPVKEIFDRGVQILGPKGRKLIGLARKDHSDVVILEAISACEEEGATDPAGFFFKCLAKRQQRPRNGIYPNEGVF